MEALFTVLHTASAPESLLLKTIIVNDRMINVQVGWHGNKIRDEEFCTCICNLRNMEKLDLQCVSTYVYKGPLSFKR